MSVPTTRYSTPLSALHTQPCQQSLPCHRALPYGSRFLYPVQWGNLHLVIGQRSQVDGNRVPVHFTSKVEGFGLHWLHALFFDGVSIIDQGAFGVIRLGGAKPDASSTVSPGWYWRYVCSTLRMCWHNRFYLLRWYGSRRLFLEVIVNGTPARRDRSPSLTLTSSRSPRMTWFSMDEPVSVSSTILPSSVMSNSREIRPRSDTPSALLSHPPGNGRKAGHLRRGSQPLLIVTSVRRFPRFRRFPRSRSPDGI